MADVKKYSFEISSSKPFWSINSIDKPYNIDDYMTWTDINIQNVNFIDSFTISFIADKDDYTYLAITDTSPSTTNRATATKYYYIETTSKRLSKGYEFIGKLDVWATFCGSIMVNHARFPQNYPLFVNRFINNNPGIWSSYYASSAYMMKDEMFDYSNYLPTTDPNGYAISNPFSTSYQVAKHNMFFASFYTHFWISFYHYGIFATSFQNPGRGFMAIGIDGGATYPNFSGTTNNSALYNLSAFRMHSKYASPLLGLLYQADNDNGTYRLVLCGLEACAIIIEKHPTNLGVSSSTYNSNYQWRYNSAYNTSNSYIIRLAGLQETIQAIKTGYGNIEGGDPQGYWYNKIKGIFYFDFIDMLDVGWQKWYFTSLAATTQSDMVKVFNRDENQTYDINSISPGIFFRDFEPQEGIPVTNRQKWRFTSIPTDDTKVLTSSTKPNYIIWNSYGYDTNNRYHISKPTIKTTMAETYTRTGDGVDYLQRYPLSRVSVDNVCLNPAFPDYFTYQNIASGPVANYYGSTGFFDTGKALIGFDGVSWVMSTGYNSKYLLTSAFTQESYPCNYSGYQDYINGVKSQQDAALTTAKNQQIFSSVMGLFGGITSAVTGGLTLGLGAKGSAADFGGGVGGIMGGIGQAVGGGVQAHLNYAAKERQIEAQNQDKRRTSQVNVVQAGNKQALGINNAKAYWYKLIKELNVGTEYNAITNLISCAFTVNAPNSLTDIHYYNSLVWKFGIQANFLIPAYPILNPEREQNYTNNPFTYFEIQELPSEFILRIYPNLQKDYINAIKAVFSGGVRQWFNGNYPQYNNNDNITITWR